MIVLFSVVYRMVKERMKRSSHKGRRTVRLCSPPLSEVEGSRVEGSLAGCFGAWGREGPLTRPDTGRGGLGLQEKPVDCRRLYGRRRGQLGRQRPFAITEKKKAGWGIDCGPNKATMCPIINRIVKLSSYRQEWFEALPKPLITNDIPSRGRKCQCDMLLKKR